MTNSKQIFDLEWFERECPYNIEAKKNREKLILDAFVVIEGERRALLSSKGARERGYQLYDLDHRPLALNSEAWKREYRNNPSFVAHKSGIGEFISQALEDGIIPTLAQLANLRNQDAINKANEEAAEKERIRISEIKKYALEMAEALYTLLVSRKESTEAFRRASYSKEVQSVLDKVETFFEGDQHD